MFLYSGERNTTKMQQEQKIMEQALSKFPKSTLEKAHHDIQYFCFIYEELNQRLMKIKQEVIYRFVADKFRG